MTALVVYRAGRALVVTLSALTLANLLELSHRLAYDTRLWAQVTSPDAPYRYFGTIGGPLAVATVVAVTALAMTVGCRCPAGRFALAAAVLHTAALGVWLGVLQLLGFGALVLAVLSERHPRQAARLVGTGAIR